MTRSNIRLAIFAVALASGLAMQHSHAAGSMSGQLNAQMVLQSGCIISGAPGAGTSGINMGSWALKFGTSYLPYEVYSDAAMTTAYPTAATSLGVVLPGTGAAMGLPVFGKINKTSGNALLPGTYTHVLQVTLAW